MDVIGVTKAYRVSITPFPWYVEYQCHSNVDMQIEMSGGEKIQGYYVIELDGIFQLIGHSIWKSADGEIVDVTPFGSINELLFIETNSLPKYNMYAESLDKYTVFNEEADTVYYVYMLVDPRDDSPFYVGKGTGKRAQTHLWNISRSHNPYKEAKIRKIREEGYEPKIEYVAENIPDESLAYDIEAKLIAKFGRKGYEEGGILTNSVPDGRPPNHKGKTYEEIYGTERAKEITERRRELQLARGGYGPRKHSEETKKKIGAKSALQQRGPLSEETKQKMRSHPKPKGKDHPGSRKYVLTSPVGEQFALYGGELKAFCKKNGLSIHTFHATLMYERGPSTRGKNAGWRIEKWKRDNYR